MNNIITVDPGQALQQSNARNFMVILTTPSGEYFTLPGGGLQRADVGKMDSPMISRDRLSEDYHTAARSLRSHPDIISGSLQIIPIPTYGG